MADAEEGTLWPAGASAASIKFSFSHTMEQRPLADTDDSGAALEEKDFLKTLEGSKLPRMKPSEPPKELVILLIQNGHRRQLPAQASGSSTNTEALVDTVLSQAVKELTENSKKSLEEREKSGVDPMLANPMIQQECIPNQEVADSKPWA